MELNLENGNRPSAALQKAMGNGAPPLDDSQCVVFAKLVDEHGGVPHGWSEAQRAFRELYTIEGDRWVKRAS